MKQVVLMCPFASQIVVAFGSARVERMFGKIAVAVEAASECGRMVGEWERI